MTKTVTTELAGLIANAVAKGNTADRAKTTAVDAMVAAGFVSTDFISPKGKDSKSTATDELFGQINAAIVAGFATRTQALVNAPSAKGMTDAQNWRAVTLRCKSVPSATTSRLPLPNVKTPRHLATLVGHVRHNSA